MTSEMDVEPPFIQDNELVVRCDYSSCNNTTSVGTEVDGMSSSGDVDNWRISFIPTADGRLEVDTVECPSHRVEDSIQRLANEQIDHAKSVVRTQRVVNKICEE